MSGNMRKHNLDMCAQGRFQLACIFVQSDKNSQWAHFWTAKDAKFLHVGNEDTN